MTNASSQFRLTISSTLNERIYHKFQLRCRVSSSIWQCYDARCMRHVSSLPGNSTNERNDFIKAQRHVKKLDKHSTIKNTMTFAELEQRSNVQIERTYRKKPVTEILQALVKKSAQNPTHFTHSYNLARYLMHRLSTDLNKETLHNIIRCLIYANAAPDGSAGRVIKHLAELEDEKISLNGEDCLAILKVLAVHPDFLLRTQILQYMESSWIGLTEEAHHYVIAGLFREMQLEKGMEELLTMREKNLRIEPWLLDLAISILTQVEELEETKEILKMKIESQRATLHPNFGVYLLSKAVELQDLKLSKLICQNYMDSTPIKLDPDIMKVVMEMATRNGDVEFAGQMSEWFQRVHGALDSKQ